MGTTDSRTMEILSYVDNTQSSFALLGSSYVALVGLLVTIDAPLGSTALTATPALLGALLAVWVVSLPAVGLMLSPLGLTATSLYAVAVLIGTVLGLAVFRYVFAASMAAIAAWVVSWLPFNSPPVRMMCAVAGGAFGWCFQNMVGRLLGQLTPITHSGIGGLLLAAVAEYWYGVPMSERCLSYALQCSTANIPFFSTAVAVFCIGLTIRLTPILFTGKTGLKTAFADNKLTGDLQLDNIPGLSDTAINHFQQSDTFDSSFSILGKYFHESTRWSQKHPATFKKLLEQHGVAESSHDTVMNSLSAFIEARGPCMRMEDDRVESSRMTHEKIEAFLARDLTGDLSADLLGIGGETPEKMRNSRIQWPFYEGVQEGTECQNERRNFVSVSNTWKLLGLALVSSDARQFEALLKTAGVATGWSATVIHQVIEKLCARACLQHQ